MSLKVEGGTPTAPTTYSPPVTEDSCWRRAEKAYERAIKNLMSWLEGWAGRAVAMAIGTILLEFSHALRAAIEWLFYSCCGTPHFSNVNPEKLTPAQLTMNPVLCLHGNYHTPSAFTGIAQALQSAHNPALFTVQLNHGQVTDEDHRIIHAKIAEIIALYRQHGVENIKIDLIGHSRGARLAFLQSANPQIERVVLIGHYANHSQQSDAFAVQDRCLQINGESDCLISEESLEQARARALEDPLHSQIINTGHLGLVYHPAVQASVVRWLKV
jgi:pimeloyl-ACP methyl ester carboxylesterase